MFTNKPLQSSFVNTLRPLQQKALGGKDENVLESHSKSLNHVGVKCPLKAPRAVSKFSFVAIYVCVAIRLSQMHLLWAPMVRIK